MTPELSFCLLGYREFFIPAKSQQVRWDKKSRIWRILRWGLRDKNVTFRSNLGVSRRVCLSDVMSPASQVLKTGYSFWLNFQLVENTGIGKNICRLLLIWGLNPGFSSVLAFPSMASRFSTVYNVSDLRTWNPPSRSDTQYPWCISTAWFLFVQVNRTAEEKSCFPICPMFIEKFVFCDS